MGCHLASDPTLAARLLAAMPKTKTPQTLAELVEDRSARLTDYWNEAYAAKYRTLVELAAKKLPEELTGTIATQLYRVMAYKDEYEVARLLTGKSFKESIETQFGKGLRLTYHLAPPALLGGLKNVRKRAFGYWMRFPMMMLARLQWLRETFLDHLHFKKNDNTNKLGVTVTSHLLKHLLKHQTIITWQLLNKLQNYRQKFVVMGISK